MRTVGGLGGLHLAQEADLHALCIPAEGPGVEEIAEVKHHLQQLLEHGLLSARFHRTLNIIQRWSA